MREGKRESKTKKEREREGEVLRERRKTFSYL